MLSDVDVCTSSHGGLTGVVMATTMMGDLCSLCNAALVTADSGHMLVCTAPTDSSWYLLCSLKLSVVARADVVGPPRKYHVGHDPLEVIRS